MKRRSIRWQLPASYAAVALLAALVLGLILLFALTSYYIQLEGNYLIRNGESISAALSGLLSRDLPPDQVKSQVDSFALISQTRIQVLDGEGNLLADSGSPAIKQSQIQFLSLSATSGSEGKSLSNYSFIINSDQTVKVIPDPNGTVIEKNVWPGELPALGSSASQVVPEPGSSSSLPQPSGKQGSVGVISTMRIVQPFSQDVSPDLRSSVKSRFDLSGPTGNRLGTMIISEGPAYSRQIVTIVAQAWGTASVLAVLLAALAGSFISRRISRPVTALAKATTRMAEGDLTARAPGASILELGQLSNAFNHMAARIEETILALRRFAADAAHELKTPLTALRTNLDLAQNELDPGRLETYLIRANDQVLQLDRLVGELLDLSRLESGTHPAVEELLDLKELVRNTSEVYATRAEQTGLSFSLELPNQPVNLLGRQIQLELAVSNLLDNALKYTHTEGWVRAKLTLEGDHAIFMVEDNGIGIPPDDLPDVFNRFHRAGNARSRQGSGLGLAIVNAVAHAHQGQVSAENRPGGGAKFTLSLPIDKRPGRVLCFS